MARSKRFTDEDLWSIVKEHQDALTSVSAWNQYAKEKGLPHSQTLINRLGSWNTIKKRLNIEVNQQHRPMKYTKEDLYDVLRKHKDAYTSIYGWNQYARKHKLPTHQVFERHLGLDELELIVGGMSHFSKENLKEQIKKQFPNEPPTVTEWRNLSKTKKVVSESTIIRKFGSWNNMKSYVYNIVSENVSKDEVEDEVEDKCKCEFECQNEDKCEYFK